jgi:hypothetical protein
MKRRISMTTLKELTEALRARYRSATFGDRIKILKTRPPASSVPSTCRPCLTSVQSSDRTTFALEAQVCAHHRKQARHAGFTQCAGRPGRSTDHCPIRLGSATSPK